MRAIADAVVITLVIVVTMILAVYLINQIYPKTRPVSGSSLLFGGAVARKVTPDGETIVIKASFQVQGDYPVEILYANVTSSAGDFPDVRVYPANTTIAPGGIITLTIVASGVAVPDYDRVLFSVTYRDIRGVEGAAYGFAYVQPYNVHPAG